MRNLILTVLIPLLAILVSKGIVAQTGVMRLEFPAELDKSPYELVLLDSSGLLFFQAQTEMLGENNRSWRLTLYDTNLVQIWDVNIPVLDGAAFQKSYLDQGKLYLLFVNTGKIKTGNENYQVSELEIGSGIINHYTGLLPDVSEIKGLVVSGDKAVVACDLQDEHASVFFVGIQSQSVQNFTPDLPDQAFIEDLQKDPYTGSVIVLVSNYLGRKQNKLQLYSLDLSGDLKGQYPVEVVLPSKFLNTARILPAGPSNYMVIGTYRNYASKIPGESDFYGIESAGFFVTRFDDGVQQYMNYYNFMELQNLRPAISARDYLKLAKKKTREEEEYSADYELMLHSLEEVSGQYILMTEAFYPDFRTVSDISYDYWGRPITHTYTVFEGFRIFQAMLLGFDQDGNLLWDNNLDLANINTDRLSTRAGFYFDGKPAVLYYNDGSKIAFRAYAKNALIEGITYADLDTSQQGDKVVELGDNFMRHWYDGYFLCYGYHTIRNNLMTEKEKRTVFYINKIIFE